MLYEFRVDATYVYLVWTTRIKRHVLATHRSILYLGIRCNQSYEMVRGFMPIYFYYLFVQASLGRSDITSHSIYLDSGPSGWNLEPELWE